MAGFVKEKEEGTAQDVDGYGGEADDKEEFCVISEVLIERKLVTLIRANVGKKVRQTRTPVLHLGGSSSRGEEQADVGEDEQPEDLSRLVHLILLADPPHWHHKPGVGQQVKKPISVAQLPKGDKVDPGKKENQGDPVKQDRKSQEESHLFCAQSLLAQILIPRVKLGESSECDAHHDEQAGEEKKED